MVRSKAAGRRRVVLWALAALGALAAGEAGARLVLKRFPPRGESCPWSEAWWRMQALANLARKPLEGCLSYPLVYDPVLGWRTSPEVTGRPDVARLPGGRVELNGARGWGHDQMLLALDRALGEDGRAELVVLRWSGDQSRRARLAWRDYARPAPGRPAPPPAEAEPALKRSSRLLLLARAAYDRWAGPPQVSPDAGLEALRARAQKAGARFSIVFEETPEEPLDGAEAAVARRACARLAYECVFAKRSTGRGARSAPSPVRSKGAFAKRRG